MANEIIKYEQQFEEIRGIINMHRERALREVNEESLQMSWLVSRERRFKEGIVHDRV